MRTTTPTQLAPQKPTIKILLYTDDPQIAPTDDFGQFFGLGSMIQRLQAHAPTFARIETKWVSRNIKDASRMSGRRLNSNR